MLVDDCIFFIWNNVRYENISPDALFFFLSTTINTVRTCTRYVLLYFSLETVVYLNLRVGRESLNQQVLAADLDREGGSDSGSRRMPGFQGGGIGVGDPSTVSSSMDYQPIQLDMDDDNKPDVPLISRVESV
jgi:hypothetical protein